MLMSASEQSALLVLVCHVEEEDTTILSPLEVADKLDLCSLSHPWQVCIVALLVYIMIMLLYLSGLPPHYLVWCLILIVW